MAHQVALLLPQGWLSLLCLLPAHWTHSATADLPSSSFQESQASCLSQPETLHLPHNDHGLWLSSLCAVTGSGFFLCKISMKMPSTSFLCSLMLCSLPSCSHSSSSWRNISSSTVHLLQARTLFSPAPAFERDTGYCLQPEIWRALSSHWSCDLSRGLRCARGSCSMRCWELCPVVQHYCWWVPHGLQQISGPLPFAFLSKLLLLRAVPWDLCSGTANTSWMGTWPSLIRTSLSQQ